MGIKLKFRVWNIDNKEFEIINNFRITKNGELKCKGRIIDMFTGLYDCSGKEIYSNDIIQIEGISKLIVGFENGCFTEKKISPEYPLYQRLIAYKSYGDYFVIGNIHENSDLI